MDNDKYPLSQYDKDFIFKVGTVSNFKRRSNHFLRFPKEKEKKAIRIGTFGDSFTHGDEVKKTWSYPAQLQKMFEKKNPENIIEILNFGMSSHGLQQHFIVWKEYAIKYNIDYILLGPEGSQPNRDLAFTIPEQRLPYLRHPRGRYIVKTDGSLAFVNISGDTFFERYNNYYSLTPSWTVLSYDKYFFNLWRGMYFPSSMLQIQNPFYYTNLNIEEEVTSINKNLLNQIKKIYPRTTLFLTSNKKVYNLYKEENFLNINYLHLFPQTPLYYRRYHYSTLGYEIWAEVFFKVLTGHTDFSIKRFQCLTEKKEATAKSKNKIKSLKEVYLYHKGLKLAKLEIKNFKNLSFNRDKNFISFFNSSEHFINNLFFSVPFQLKTNKIFIKTAGRKFFLGSIFPLDEKNVFFGFQKDYISTFRIHSYGFPDSSYLTLNRNTIPQLSPVKKMYLYIDNYKIANLKLEKDREDLNIYRIIPKKQRSFFFVGQLKDSTLHKDLPDQINLSFKYIDNENKYVHSMVLGFPCVKKKEPIHINLPSFDFPNI